MEKTIESYPLLVNTMAFKVKSVVFCLDTVSRTAIEMVVQMKLNAWLLDSLFFLRMCFMCASISYHSFSGILQRHYTCSKSYLQNAKRTERLQKTRGRKKSIMCYNKGKKITSLWLMTQVDYVNHMIRYKNVLISFYFKILNDSCTSIRCTYYYCRSLPWRIYSTINSYMHTLPLYIKKWNWKFVQIVIFMKFYEKIWQKHFIFLSSLVIEISSIFALHSSCMIKSFFQSQIIISSFASITILDDE